MTDIDTLKTIEEIERLAAMMSVNADSDLGVSDAWISGNDLETIYLILDGKRLTVQRRIAGWDLCIKVSGYGIATNITEELKAAWNNLYQKVMLFESRSYLD